jgi:hypothetical protein
MYMAAGSGHTRVHAWTMHLLASLSSKRDPKEHYALACHSPRTMQFASSIFLYYSSHTYMQTKNFVQNLIKQIPPPR